MPIRTVALALLSASVVSSVAACQTPSTPASIALTRQPCDLLTPEVAKKYVGADAQRQLSYDSTPPVAVGDTGCYYTGDQRSVSVAVYPVPTNPTAPVNHFDVIRPDNRVEGVDYEAYWFGPGESLVAVKNGLFISVSVSNRLASQTDRDRADDVELANLVVPHVG